MKNINTLLSLVDKFSAPMSNITKKTKDAEREFRKAQNTLNNFGNGVKAKLGGVKSMIGNVAGAMGVLGAGAFVMDGINTFKDFDSAMKNLAATAGITASETNAEYKAMMDKARELGRSTSKTAKESADAMRYMKLAGWETKDVLEQVDKVLALSEAGQMDLARASDLATDSMSALGLSANQMARYLDVVAKAQTSSNTSAEQLMEAYIGVGGMMHNLNVPIEESATALGVLANRGKKGSEAGNALSSILINLTSGAGEAGKAMESIGVSAFDAQGNFKGLRQTLAEVDNATKNMTQEQRNSIFAMIGGKTQVDTLNALMSGLNITTKDGRKEWDALNDTLVKYADGSLKKAQKTMNQTLDGSMKRFRSAIEDVQIALIQGFAPAMSTALDTMASDVLPVFASKLEYFGRDILPQVIDALDTLSPILAGTMGYFVAFKILTTINTLYQSFIAVTQGLSIAQAILNAVMMANPLTWVAVGVGALIALVVLLWKNWDKVKESLQGAFKWFDDFTTWLTSILKPILEPIINMIDSMANGLSKISKVKLFGGNDENQSSVPSHATGSSYFAGGLTRINEGGRGEIVNLPNGSQIVPHDKSSSGIKNVINNTITIQGNVIGDDDFVNMIGEKITQRVQMALNNI